MSKTVPLEKYVLVVAALGLTGLIVSIFLLSDYSEPLMNIVRVYVEHFKL